MAQLASARIPKARVPVRLMGTMTASHPIQLPRAARLGALLLAAIPLAAGPARAQAGEAAAPDIPEVLEVGETHRVTEIVDGDTLYLSDGREVRLVGLQAPKLPLGRPDFEPWPLSDDAKAKLSELVLGREVTLAYGGRPVDRHRRMLAHLYLPDGTWVQGRLLEAGLARVYTFRDNRELAGEMYALEDAARAADRGIWDHPFYAVRSKRELGALIGTFQVVEARVADVAEVDGRVYINFGRDWRTDFTVTLRPDVRRLFEAEGIDPEVYDDHAVQVRGWLERYNGPLIEATHPEQIRRMDE
jgi:endonuclease YncB( thermonuclease family)